MTEYESFDEWFRGKSDEEDVEVQEWSRFMGYRVNPMEIVELRISFRQKLDQEGSGLSLEEADRILEEWERDHET